MLEDRLPLEGIATDAVAISAHFVIGRGWIGRVAFRTSGDTAWRTTDFEDLGAEELLAFVDSALDAEL